MKTFIDNFTSELDKSGLDVNQVLAAFYVAVCLTKKHSIFTVLSKEDQVLLYKAQYDRDEQNRIWEDQELINQAQRDVSAHYCQEHLEEGECIIKLPDSRVDSLVKAYYINRTTNQVYQYLYENRPCEIDIANGTLSNTITGRVNRIETVGMKAFSVLSYYDKMRHVIELIRSSEHLM